MPIELPTSIAAGGTSERPRRSSIVPARVSGALARIRPRIRHGWNDHRTCPAKHRGFPRRRCVEPRRGDRLLHGLLARAGAAHRHRHCRARLRPGCRPRSDRRPAELSGLMGQQSAEALQSMLKSAAGARSSTLATAIGLITLLLTATGVFAEIQTSLNAIWRAAPRRSTVSRLIRARLVSLALILSLGFLLIVSLAFSAALAALGNYLNSILPAIRR